MTEQACPRGRTVLLRNTVDGKEFSTAHRSQTIYHGPVTLFRNTRMAGWSGVVGPGAIVAAHLPEGSDASRPARVPLGRVGGDGTR